MPKIRAKPQPLNKPTLTPWMVALAALLAALEIAPLLLSGGYFEWGRAEALPFISFRAFVLLLGALIVAWRPVRQRAAFYLLLLVSAASSETLLVLALGADNPWPEMLRGLLFGALLAVLIDLVLQAGRRLWKSAPVPLAALIFASFLTPFVIGPLSAIVTPPPEPVKERPELMLMTALPIIWGEGGAFDPESRPAASYQVLDRYYQVRPLDVLDETSLRNRKLLLLAQPRALNPEELVALDAWVRGGGRAVILTDPALVWPTELPLGDIRRPPPVGLLQPLLDHWGLGLAPPLPERRGIVDERVGERKLRLAAPGRFESRGRACSVAQGGLIADCRIGEGRALLVADADLMHDETWVLGEMASDDGRFGRVADNVLAVADMLDRLSGTERTPPGGLVEWADPDADPTLAVLLALLPILAGLGVGLALVLKRRR
ncbi:MAG TPA: Gldg family protein [Allosphingosinicella sp.]|uniref:Gldg family protein n=1 Tax=Allosphingosinicella sp. TaxID=2823234 RepID=UPI002ED97DC0